MRTRAATEVTVDRFESKPYDQSGGPVLKEVTLRETFAGDIDGEGTSRALQVVRDDRIIEYVAIERFRGRIGDREGTFVLQGPGRVENGKITGRWVVVPGSGTEELTGLRGEGGFEGELGKASHATLEYWFE
jgi:hypothetical protein